MFISMSKLDSRFSMQSQTFGHHSIIYSYLFSWFGAYIKHVSNNATAFFLIPNLKQWETTLIIYPRCPPAMLLLYSSMDHMPNSKVLNQTWLRPAGINISLFCILRLCYEDCTNIMWDYGHGHYDDISFLWFVAIKDWCNVWPWFTDSSWYSCVVFL